MRNAAPLAWVLVFVSGTTACGYVCGEGTRARGSECIADDDDVSDGDHGDRNVGVTCQTTTRRSAVASCDGLTFTDCSDDNEYRLHCDVDGCYCSKNGIEAGRFNFTDRVGCESYWGTEADIHAAFEACGLDVTGQPAPPTE
jgi:hypothetical protein